jgi:trigger factor
VKTKELPELDDEFASTASEFDTLEELREDVRTRLARTKVLQQGAQARDKLVEHLLETVEVPIPENLSSARSSGATRRCRTSSRVPAWTGTTFLQMSGVESQEAYDADQRKNIEEAVRTQFILDAVADAREVTVDNEDLSAQIMAQAQRNRMSPEQYAQQLQQGGNIAEFVATSAARRPSPSCSSRRRSPTPPATSSTSSAAPRDGAGPGRGRRRHRVRTSRGRTAEDATAVDGADDAPDARSPTRPPSRRPRAPPPDTEDVTKG